MDMLNLHEGEQVVYEKKGDWWTTGFSGRQIPGIFQVTNERVAHRGKALLGTAKENSFEVNLRDIVSIEKCNVGEGLLKVIPTGVKLKTNNGETYILSVLNRKELIDVIQSNK